MFKIKFNVVLSVILLAVVLSLVLSYPAQAAYVTYNGVRVYYGSNSSYVVKGIPIRITIPFTKFWQQPEAPSEDQETGKNTGDTAPSPQEKPSTPSEGSSGDVVNEPAPAQPAPDQSKPSTTDGSEPSAQQPSSNYQLTADELKMIDLVNQERQKAGVAPLKIDHELCRVARIKSQDMRENGYFSHNSPTYGSPFQMMKDFGISYRSAGENIAKAGSVERAHNGLMNSEGHRKNILNPNFTHIGVGIDGNYYTQMFISK